MLRAKVEMDRAGRAGALEAVSGECESARVDDGVLLCEEDVLLVRSEALRAIVTELAMDRRLGGVAGAFSYWLAMGRGASSSTGGRLRLRVGGVVEDGVLGCFPPKMDGRREKRPFAVLRVAWSPIVKPPSLSHAAGPKMRNAGVSNQGLACAMAGSLLVLRGEGGRCIAYMYFVW